MADGAAVEQAGHRAAHVAHDQAHRAPDREIRAPAGTEEVVARVDVELTRDRSVDDHQHGRAGGRRARAVITPALVADPLDCGHHDRHVLRLAARHHRVDRDFLGRDRHEPIADIGELGIRREPDRVQHGAHRRLGGRDDRQSVAPASVEAEVHGGSHVVDLETLGRECARHDGPPGACPNRRRHATTLRRVAATAHLDRCGAGVAYCADSRTQPPLKNGDASAVCPVPARQRARGQILHGVWRAPGLDRRRAPNRVA